MKLSLKLKSWDSEFFGYKIYEAIIHELDVRDLPKFYHLIKLKCARLVYLLPKDDQSKKTIEEKIASCIDTKVTYLKNINYTGHTYTDLPIKSYKMDENYPQLIRLAIESGKNSRFKKDAHFISGSFERLYTTWIYNSIKKLIADDVLVYYLENTIIGLITYKIFDNELKIGLIAVDKDWQGKGIGKSMIASIENLAHLKNCRKVIVSTQKENMEAVRFYTSRGYHVQNEQPTYHLWI